jgi:hypothetical protein
MTTAQYVITVTAKTFEHLNTSMAAWHEQIQQQYKFYISSDQRDRGITMSSGAPVGTAQFSIIAFVPYKSI